MLLDRVCVILFVLAIGTEWVPGSPTNGMSFVQSYRFVRKGETFNSENGNLKSNEPGKTEFQPTTAPAAAEATTPVSDEISSMLSVQSDENSNESSNDDEAGPASESITDEISRIPSYDSDQVPEVKPWFVRKITPSLPQVPSEASTKPTTPISLETKRFIIFSNGTFVKKNNDDLKIEEPRTSNGTDSGVVNINLNFNPALLNHQNKDQVNKLLDSLHITVNIYNNRQFRLRKVPSNGQFRPDPVLVYAPPTTVD